MQHQDHGDPAQDLGAEERELLGGNLVPRVVKRHHEQSTGLVGAHVEVPPRRGGRGARPGRAARVERMQRCLAPGQLELPLALGGALVEPVVVARAVEVRNPPAGTAPARAPLAQAAVQRAGHPCRCLLLREIQDVPGEHRRVHGGQRSEVRELPEHRGGLNRRAVCAAGHGGKGGVHPPSMMMLPGVQRTLADVRVRDVHQPQRRPRVTGG
mmetsp:Transcript_50664/g.151556  ORF Transcript_50664/g.151556 Transcript_50664/m.151556 type:complete len:212 (+) Transcript_50664:1084-1719(+)